MWCPCEQHSTNVITEFSLKLRFLGIIDPYSTVHFNYSLSVLAKTNMSQINESVQLAPQNKKDRMQLNHQLEEG